MINLLTKHGFDLFLHSAGQASISDIGGANFVIVLVNVASQDG